jgi:hypothetical protein
MYNISWDLKIFYIKILKSNGKIIGTSWHENDKRYCIHVKCLKHFTLYLNLY